MLPRDYRRTQGYIHYSGFLMSQASGLVCHHRAPAIQGPLQQLELSADLLGKFSWQSMESLKLNALAPPASALRTVHAGLGRATYVLYGSPGLRMFQGCSQVVLTPYSECVRKQAQTQAEALALWF
ncbi:hypothetical protein O181_003812 [Austropuccinia psidii MF-1]|uniref:Uncharacterized protein n=1 Tax=Austropuccinia psidii MF-1 TaxID=1389203 RepID=A0A9Q3GF78_9BASI|nr:hypothetical protein [Austropuccinia psidii MF-1]